ncbi:MAG: glutamine synthetase [Chloroflexi bacterium]|nr:glutamine synthetase [Chloroflexota bacterium]
MTQVKHPELIESIGRRIQDERIKFLNLQFTDIVGMVKNVTIPAGHYEECITYGVWFDGSSIEGFARIAESDMYLVPDLSTYAVIPWDKANPHTATARIICDVYTPNGDRYEGDPRAVLDRVMQRARDMGYTYNTGTELEFFLFKPHADGILVPLVYHDNAGYFDVSTDLAHNVRRQMVNALQEFGIVVEAAHHEVAVGQHEIDFEYSDALRTADNAVTLRITLKAIAQLNNLYCTFMPKPMVGINGSGMHTHQSFSDAQTGKNLFYDGTDPYGLSQLARQFIAGQLLHARGMIPILAPLINSYKRLVPGYEAPVYISWARANRSALIRVPKINPGKAQAARIELRCPDPSCNPYLAFAVMLAAGLDGIERGLVPPDPSEENLYHLDAATMQEHQVTTLPSSLQAAIAELEKDQVVQAALGPHIVERFIEAKQQEINDYRIQVTPWELERYLGVF